MMIWSPSKQACVCWRLWAFTSMACISMPNIVRHDICRHNYRERTGRQLLWSITLLLPTLLSDSQVCFDLTHHTWSLMNRFRAGQGPCTNGVSPNHLPVIMVSQWQTMNHIVDMCPLTKFKVDWIYSTKRMTTQSCGWNLQRLQHSRNNNK